MRTAKEIRKSKKHYYWTDMGGFYHDGDIEDMINEARKEAIEECAERAKVDFYEIEYEGVSRSVYEKVDKESILSLIKELK